MYFPVEFKKAMATQRRSAADFIFYELYFIVQYSWLQSWGLGACRKTTY